MLNALLIWHATKLGNRFKKADDLDPNEAYRRAGKYFLEKLEQDGYISGVFLLGYNHDDGTADPFVGEAFVGTVSIKGAMEEIMNHLWFLLKQYKIRGTYDTPFRCLYCGKEGEGHPKTKFCQGPNSSSCRTLFCKGKKFLSTNKGKLAPVILERLHHGEPVKIVVNDARRYLRRQKKKSS